MKFFRCSGAFLAAVGGAVMSDAWTEHHADKLIIGALFVLVGILTATFAED